MRTSAYDRWATAEPPEVDFDHATVKCPDGCTDGDEGWLVEALAWTETGRREVPVWGCDGLTAEMLAAGYVAVCSRTTDLHEAHEETAPEITYRGKCPLCLEELTRVEGPW